MMKTLKKIGLSSLLLAAYGHAMAGGGVEGQGTGGVSALVDLLMSMLAGI